MYEQETTNKGNEYICTKLNELIEKYGFVDVEYAFGIVANPTLSATLSSSLASHKNIEPLETGDPDFEALQEVVKLLDKRDLIVHRPADNFQT